MKLCRVFGRYPGRAFFNGVTTMAMEEWIAIRLDIATDPDVVRIANRMKPAVRPEVVVGYLHAVWAWASKATEDGVITGLTLDQIEETLHLPTFLHLMQEVGWVSEIIGANGSVVTFENWQVWNSESRKKRLKEAKRKQLERSDKSRTNVRKTADKKRTRCSSSCSSSSSSSSGSSSSSSSSKKEVAEIVSHYQEHHPRSRPGDAERKKIRSRLDEGWTVQDLKDAIDGIHLSPFHTGDNDNGQKHLGLKVVFRDGDQVQKFIDIKAAGGVKIMTDVTRSIVRAGREFLENENL